ncbi:unnamed protein product [Boreogadus saida]
MVHLASAVATGWTGVALVVWLYWSGSGGLALLVWLWWFGSTGLALVVWLYWCGSGSLAPVVWLNSPPSVRRNQGETKASWRMAL